MPSHYRDPRAPAPNRPLRVGARALVERGCALLLGRCADGGTRGLIGGALDGDESLSEAVRREVREETGPATRSIELFGVLSDPSRIVAYADGNVYRVLAVVFRVGVEDGNPIRSEESHEVRFVARREPLGLDLTPAHRHIIEAFLGGPDRAVLE